MNRYHQLHTSIHRIYFTATSQPTNLFLDKKLHLKLSDFQRKLLSKDGEVLLDGGSSEPCQFYFPRGDPFEADIKTDLFVLGCTIYFVMMGHPVFPDITHGAGGWYDRFADRFAMEQFPQDSDACSAITLKCWLRQYGSAQDIVREIETIEKRFAAEGGEEINGKALFVAGATSERTNCVASLWEGR